METGLAGLSKSSVREPWPVGSGAAAVLETSEGPSSRAAADPQLSGRLWAERSLGLEEGGDGNVELAVAQPGLRAVYSRTLGISKVFPQ